jgi:hypothetical protein
MIATDGNQHVKTMNEVTGDDLASSKPVRTGCQVKRSISGISRRKWSVLLRCVSLPKGK